MICEGKTVLITGASSGIGRELAVQLAAKNNRLLLVARREERLRELVQSLPEDQDHRIYVCDVSVQKEVESVCQRITGEGIDIDVLLLNAGVSGKFLVDDFDMENFRNIFEVNFFGVVYFVKYLLPGMLKRNSGTVAAVSSLAGYRGMPKSAPYAASKAALSNFIESLRIDLWKTGINCVLISPGFVVSEMTAKNRFTMPFMMETGKAVRRIIRGLEKEKPEICFPLCMTVFAKISRLLPYHLYARIMQNRRKD